MLLFSCPTFLTGWLAQSCVHRRSILEVKTEPRSPVLSMPVSTGSCSTSTSLFGTDASKMAETWCTASVSVSLLFGGLIVYILYKIFKPEPKNLPPGPRGFTALRTTLSAMKELRLHKQSQVWAEQYGELVLCRSALGDMCFLNSARLIREVFGSKQWEMVANDRVKGFYGWHATYKYMDLAMADLSTPDWPKKRRLFHSALRFYGDGVERFERTVQNELRRLVTSLEDREGEEIDVMALLSTSIVNVLLVLLTGECPKQGAPIAQALKDFDATINEVMSPSVDGILTAFPFLRLIPGTYYRDIYLRLKEGQNNSSHTPGKPRGFVDVFLDEQLKEENHWLKDDSIRGMLVNVIAGGYLTSLLTLRVFFLCLIHHPEVTQKIQQEIDDVLGDREACVEDKSNLPYTEAAVLETLRYGCLLPFGVPHLARDDVMVDGYKIPKGSMIIGNAWLTHHDPNLWDKPEQFRPERFLDDVTGDLLPATHPLRQGVQSFGVGRRSCPGESFARSRLFLYASTLLQKFDILPPVKHELPPWTRQHYEDGIILKPPPYRLIFRRRA
ncbi:hypothetical protein BaRGS_00033415 [Batillaria attramentaria]|uniref:Cytochrome P450 n=1 Tax=Batillaria attramentaria TaxID=370345 RepID=A0ABD0JK30_9CAEN